MIQKLINLIQKPHIGHWPLANGTSLVRYMNNLYGKPSTQKPYVQPCCTHTPTNLRPTSFTTIIPYIEKGGRLSWWYCTPPSPLLIGRTAVCICNWAPTKTLILLDTAALPYLHSNWTKHEEPPFQNDTHEIAPQTIYTKRINCYNTNTASV